ncbi:MAG: hypothetical protein ACWGHH_06485 [Sulfurovaceae bacterium]
MSAISKVLGFLGVNKTNIESEKIDTENVMKELLRYVSMSMPRNLTYGQAAFKMDMNSRDAEYLGRHELYEDPFTREMIKVIIARAIGVEHNDSVPFQLYIQEHEIPESTQKLIKEEFAYIEKLIIDDLFEVAMDSQFYGDGYVAIKAKENEGITKLVCNFATKPFNIIPIVSNYGDDMAFEVAPNMSLLGKTKHETGLKNGRKYISPYKIARMNARSNGALKPQVENMLTIENMNAFSDDITYYEDMVYGGVTEGCLDSFHNFKWAVESLANMRIASSVIERYLTVALDSLSEKERTLIKGALEANVKRVQDEIKEKTKLKDPTALIKTHIIPTMANGAGGVNIQESTPNFNQQIDDILFHIKRYLGDIGFNIQLTPYGESNIGGGEKDGTVQSSIQMDVQGMQIRKSVQDYILHIVKVHFLAKYNLEIDVSKIGVDFSATINTARINAETQRMEAITNTQQFGSIIDQFKMSAMKDTEDTRHFLRETFEPLISNTATDKEKMLDSIIEHILTKPAPIEGTEPPSPPPIAGATDNEEDNNETNSTKQEQQNE